MLRGPFVFACFMTCVVSPRISAARGARSARAALDFRILPIGEYAVGATEIRAIVFIKNTSGRRIAFGFERPSGSGAGLISSVSYRYVAWRVSGQPGERLPICVQTFAGPGPVDFEGDCVEPYLRYVLDPGQQVGDVVTVGGLDPFPQTGRAVVTLGIRVSVLREDLSCAPTVPVVEKRVPFAIEVR